MKFPVLGLGHTICDAVTMGSVSEMGMEMNGIIINYGNYNSVCTCTVENLSLLQTP